MPEPVYLYQYDLSNGMAQSLGPMLVGRPVEGIWHTSLVLYGVEVWFGQGIHSKSPPGTTHHGAPRKKVAMGETHLDRDTFLEYIEGMRETYQAERYHLLEFNCNHFTNDVIGFLNGNSIPREILDQPKELMATPFGQQMRPMIEQMFVGANRRSAGDAVNHLLPTLAQTPTRPQQTNDDVPSVASVASNLQIVTSIASLRSTLERCPGTSIMFTSASCPPCNAIKPHFEELARGFAKLTFCLVETGLGEGAEIARMQEFGGPVMATPTFVFFKGVERVGECKGADKGELETRVGMLNLEVFPPHPHAKLELPRLSKLAQTLSPITFTAFPPLAALSTKLSTLTARLSASDAAVLTKDVPSYLASLPVPPQPPLSTPPLDPAFLSAWFGSTLAALERRDLDPVDKFPIVDLIRLALARDLSRLVGGGGPRSSSTFLVDALPRVLRVLVEDLEGSPVAPRGSDAPPMPPPSHHAYLVTAVKLVSNLFASPVATEAVLAPSPSTLRRDVTKLLIRAVLDDDAKARSFGAGLGWTVVAKVSERRQRRRRASGGGGGASDGRDDDEEEEWESELGGAVVEALGREEKSVEVVHRLTATLGLLVYESSYHVELRSLLEVLDANDVLERKKTLVKDLAQSAQGEGQKDTKEVLGVIEDVQKLLA
ncbi:hypothetical protein JCM11491_006725 [Sporobolomyces phaffii]